MKDISWNEKYELALKEFLTIKEIALLRSIGQPKAIGIRKKALEYCIKNDIEVYPQKIPTEAIFAVTNCDLEYYYEKMLKEADLRRIMKGTSYVSS